MRVNDRFEIVTNFPEKPFYYCIPPAVGLVTDPVKATVYQVDLVIFLIFSILLSSLLILGGHAGEVLCIYAQAWLIFLLHRKMVGLFWGRLGAKITPLGRFKFMQILDTIARLKFFRYIHRLRLSLKG